MQTIKTILTILYMIDSVALTIIVLMQEGKQAGLGTIGGMADTFWGKNKGRSREGLLKKLTAVLAVLFLVIAVVLNLNVWNK